MEEYKIAVENFAKNGENFEFTNKGQVHAGIVVTNMIKHAEEEILIYSGCLDQEVANNEQLINELNIFIRSGNKLRVIIDHMPSPDQISDTLKLILNLQSNENSNIILKVDEDNTFSNLIEQSFNNQTNYHFMVIDEKAYRFETDIENYKAICNFNDTEIAIQLKELFTQYLSN